MPLEFFDLGCGDGKSELGLGFLRADPLCPAVMLPGHLGMYEDCRGTVKIGVCVHEALLGGHSLCRGLPFSSLMG